MIDRKQKAEIRQNALLVLNYISDETPLGRAARVAAADALWLLDELDGNEPVRSVLG